MSVHFLFPFHQQELVVIQGQVAVLITEVIGLTVLGMVNMGMVIEVHPLCRQFFQGNFGLACRVEFLQYTPVTLQDVIDIAHHIIAAAVQLVVVIVAALVVAKLFVGTAVQHFAAVKAVSFFAHIQLR